MDCPCVEAPRDSVLLVHTWPLMVDFSFGCSCTSFCGCHQQRETVHVSFLSLEELVTLWNSVHLVGHGSCKM